MERVKNIAIIFAGGVGSRMGSEIPKQFLQVYGKEIIIHTLEKFQYNDNVDLIYVGCVEEYIHDFEQIQTCIIIIRIPSLLVTLPYKQH